MPAYKLTAEGNSCKLAGDLERLILEQDPVKYSRLITALQESQGDPKGSFIGNFEEEDLEKLVELSKGHTEAYFRLAISYFEGDPEWVDVFEFKNGEGWEPS